MLRLFFTFILMVFSLNIATAKEEPVYSTQGIELDQDIAKSKPSTEQKTEQKQIKNRSKKYIKYKQQIIKQDTKRTFKQKEIEYLEKRLEAKKEKLEQLNSDKE